MRARGASTPPRIAAGALRESFSAGRAGAGNGTPAASDSPPAWARAMKRRQAVSHGASALGHTLNSGDSHGGGSSINLSESDR